MRSNRFLWTLVLLIAFIGLTVSSQEVDGLVRRQDEEETSTPVRVRSTSTTAPSKTEEPDSDITPAPTESEADSEDDNNTKDKEGTDEDAGTTSVRVRSSSESVRTRGTTTKVNPNSPAGSIVMVTPAVSDGFQLYPIGTQITWVYNYTNVLISPTAINVEAFCSRTQQMYTIIRNYSVSETTVVWDTEEYEKTGKPGLPAETMTLYMYDSAVERTSVPQPGKLGVFSSFQFAMYTPRAYTPLSEYKCPTCSDASSLLHSHSIKVLLGTSLLVTMGFAWFVHGAM